MPRKKKKASALLSGKKVPGKPFVKGDPRIFRGSTKIKGFYELRALAREISQEEVTDKKQLLTRAEKILRDLAVSRNKKDQVKFLEIAFGKVEDRVINMDFDIERLFSRVDTKKLSAQQLEQLASGKNIIEVLLAEYL